MVLNTVSPCFSTFFVISIDPYSSLKFHMLVVIITSASFKMICILQVYYCS